MMFISGVLLFILYGSIGFTDAAPRSASYDSASPLSRRLRSASVTEVLPGTSLHQLPEDWGVLRALKRLIRAPGPPLSAQDIGGSTTPARRPGTEPFSQHVSSSESDWRRRPGAARRSTDAQTSVFSPEKMLQMVSMIPQRTANDAWSTDHIDTSVPSKDQGQGECVLLSNDEPFSSYIRIGLHGAVVDVYTTQPILTTTHLRDYVWKRRAAGFDAESVPMSRSQQWPQISLP